MHGYIKALALTLLLIFAFAPQSFADMKGDNGKSIPTVSVNISVKHLITGDKYKGDDKFTFTLAAEDPASPMPEGSSGGVKTINVAGDQPVEFGPIEYTHPDPYYYRLSRTFRDTKSLTHEDKSFRIMIVKYNDSTVQTVTWDERTGEKVDEIIFTDTYKVPKKKGVSPATGDSPAIYIAAGIFILAAILLLIMGIRRMTNREEDVIYEE